MRTQAWGVSHGGNALVVGRGGVLDVPVSIVQALFWVFFLWGVHTTSLRGEGGAWRWEMLELVIS